jgi:hypothetical protein
MVDAGRGEALHDEQTALERQDTGVAAAVRSYLKLAGGDPRQALALAVRDGIGTAALVSRGYTRWGEPERPSRNTPS